MQKIPVAIAKGDGIGPEIMDACLSILSAAGAPLDFHEVQIGEKVYLEGESAGISPEAWDTIRNTKAFYKAPITTPQGGGFKSLNVTVRTTLGLYANVRPCKTFVPYIKSKHDKMDVIIVRENEEDLYAGIEYRATQESVEAIKLISRSGCERIIRYAFEHARELGRKKVTCFSKDNILKLTDGLFHQVFEEIAQEYPDLENEHWIIDIGSAKLADSPENFDVIVCANLYGDIISDIAAQVAGSVGLAGSANIGAKHAMFEAIHGSAPRRAGQNLANPTGLLMGGIMMLQHLDMHDIAARVYNGWVKTIEDGIHTYDIFEEKRSTMQVGTKEFAQAIIKRLGQLPQQIPALKEKGPKTQNAKQSPAPKRIPRMNKQCQGMDVFLESTLRPQELAQKVQDLLDKGQKLDYIANRGVGVWPKLQPETLCIDQYRCRIILEELSSDAQFKLAKTLTKLCEHLDICQMHYLFLFDGRPSYSLSQHQQ